MPLAVTEAYDLTAPGHPRSRRFVCLALPEGAACRTDDHLTVLPGIRLSQLAAVSGQPCAPRRTALPWRARRRLVPSTTRELAPAAEASGT
ncbi:hypothetical protein ACFVTC_19595 [Streptomyces sp. NPDC057950]|uniref:hypothetical protein n=1 Tax=Streptomyces sp. NPDC057950 TaxID=3346288 RepID=UPI0036E36EB0